MMSLRRALSVDILAFFITDTLGPTQVQKTNFDLLDSSSPVCKGVLREAWLETTNNLPVL